MSGIKMTGTQLNKYLDILEDTKYMENNEKSDYLTELYNCTLDEDVKHICRALWRTEQSISEIEAKALTKLGRKK